MCDGGQRGALQPGRIGNQVFARGLSLVLVPWLLSLMVLSSLTVPFNHTETHNHNHLVLALSPGT